MIACKENNETAVEIEFTKEQEAAINYRGGSLLVSAAAGSGKTRVLVERLLSYIDDGAGIDEFLVITYTRAAAFELREKIHDELHKKLAKSPSNRLRRQTILCSGALIDTIHTICGEILRENAHLVGLTPDFRIADASESTMIMTDVADTVINNINNEIDEHHGFNALIDIIVQSRDDKQLINVMVSIYNKIRSKANYTSWLYEQIEAQNYNEIKDISETIYGSLILKKLHNKVEYWHSEMECFYEEMQMSPDFNAQYSESVEEIIVQINSLKLALSMGWDEAKSKSNFEFIRPKPIKGYEDLKEIRRTCVTELKKITAELDTSSAEHIKELEKLSEAVTAFYKMLIVFDGSYAQEKQRKGVADFADLEHLTLSILTSKEDGTKTEIAENLSKRFKEIMIDEYQDVNEVQELIFKAISKNESNIFMVGDVKQAIYRFRLADPTIFLSKYKEFREYEYPELANDARNKKIDQVATVTTSKNTGTTIHLSKNFRSQAHILNAVNDVFSEIMTTEFGELDYTEKEMLVPEREDEQYDNGEKREGIKGSVQVNILNIPTNGVYSEEESPTTLIIEAEYIASEVEKLTDGTHLIPDKNGEVRPIKRSDIVILLRSMKGTAWQYAAALSERGIESELPGGEGFFETIEVSSILALLSIIDNPHQDIPLAAFLAGPMCEFTSDELAIIRICNPEFTYYESIKRIAVHEMGSSEMRCKCREILEFIRELRLLAADMPADRFIWHVYNKTGLLGLVGAMNGGERRKGRLIALAESASRFEKNEYKGLYGFLTYITKLQERGDDIASGVENRSTTADEMNVVRIMSIHKSKGLEFPIVFLANTKKQFNYNDIRQNVVFHNKIGVGTMLVDKKKRIKHTTLPRAAIQTRLQDEMLSEELRVLYVAMTRARERLIITAAVKGAERIIDKTSIVAERKVEATDKIAPQAMMSLKNTLEWVLTGISASKSNAFTVNILEMDETNGINREIINKTEEKIELKENLDSSEEIENKKQDEISFESSFKYKYQSLIDLPSKLTVTEIVEQQDPEAAKLEWINTKVRQTLQSRLPSFISEERKISGAERGILLHLVMQHIDYKNLSHEYNSDIGERNNKVEDHDNKMRERNNETQELNNEVNEQKRRSTDCKKSSIEKELERLVNLQIITDAQLDDINIIQLERFFSSDLGRRLLSAESVKREFKFSMLTPAKKYYKDADVENKDDTNDVDEKSDVGNKSTDYGKNAMSGKNDESDKNDDDKILVQGVIDCYFEESKEIIVVDFKSDKVTDETVHDRAKRYAPQLNIYADAINRITGKVVKEKIIYFLTIDKAYNIE